MSDVQIGYRLQFFYVDKNGDPRTKDRGRYPITLEQADHQFKNAQSLPPIEAKALCRQLLAHIDEVFADCAFFEPEETKAET